MRVRAFSVVLVVIAVAGVAPMAVGQPAPTPPQALTAFIGDWTGTGTLTDPEHAGVAVQGTMSCATAAAGFAVLCQEHWTGPDGLTHDEVAILGQDITGDGLLHFYAVTADGFAHDHPGSYDEASGFTFEHTGAMGGALFSERIHMTLSSESALHYSVHMFVGQTEMLNFEGDLTKS